MFKRWQADANQSSVLWVHGDPGKGKTMFSIFMIEQITQQIESSASPEGPGLLLYYFFDLKDDRHKTIDRLLRGLLYHLGVQRPNLIRPVREEYQRQGESTFSKESTLKRLLKETVAQIPAEPIYIIIDALDECNDQSRTEFLEHLRTQWSRSKSAPCVKWFLTSRNAASIREVLTLELNISLEESQAGVSSDVDLFINSKVKELSSSKRFDTQMAAFVRNTFEEKAQGSFLWVSLAYAELRRARAIQAKEVLGRLPAGLYALYDKLLEQVIQLEDETLSKFALETLRSVAVAFRPLRLSELAVAANLPREHRSSPDMIREYTEACGSLLSHHELTVSLVHQSAKDYLVLPSTMAKMSLHLNYQNKEVALRGLEQMARMDSTDWEPLLKGIVEDIKDGRIAQDVFHAQVIEDPISETPDDWVGFVLNYSTLYWASHALESGLDISVDLPLDHLIFQETSQLRNQWLNSYWVANEWLARLDPPTQFGPLHFMALLGLVNAAKRWISQDSKGKRDVDVRDSLGRTPLSYAVGCSSPGNIEMVTLLLHHGASELNSQDVFYTTPLMYAVHARTIPIVNLLMAHSALFDAPIYWTWTWKLADTQGLEELQGASGYNKEIQTQSVAEKLSPHRRKYYVKLIKRTLTGTWTGKYHYSESHYAADPPSSFSLSILGNIAKGSDLAREVISFRGGGMDRWGTFSIRGHFEGWRSNSITWAKWYEGPTQSNYGLTYSGTVELEGRVMYGVSKNRNIFTSESSLCNAFSAGSDKLEC